MVKLMCVEKIDQKIAQIKQLKIIWTGFTIFNYDDCEDK